MTPEETKQRAIRLVLDHPDKYPNLTAARAKGGSSLRRACRPNLRMQRRTRWKCEVRPKGGVTRGGLIDSQARGTAPGGSFMDKTPFFTFTSHIDGKNAKVSVFQDRVE